MLAELIREMLTLIGGLIVAYVIYVLIRRKNDKPTADPPTVAHTALREIVERAVNEAQKLPSLGGSDETERTQEGRNIAEHSYEDLLATAILNKVIEKYQKEQVDGNSNVLHEKPTARTKCTLSESELGLDEGVEEGCSSLEPLSQDDCSDCSASCSRHVRNKLEPLSLTIEERIEEVTTTYTSDEDHRDNDVLAIRNAHRVPFPELGMDIIDPSQESSEDGHDEPDTPTSHVDLISPVESWEENWLFQKKRVQTQADPVAMLVPNSSADFKALIGDKDAEDTSDLSECSSAQSDEEIEKELMEAINNVVPRSPKKLEFNGANNLDERTSNDLHPTEICESEILFNGISQRERNDDETEDLEKTDKQISKEATAQNDDTKNCRIRGNDEEKESLNKNVEPNASDAGGKNEAKEITVELCNVENQKAHGSPSGDIKCTVAEDVLECKKPIVESSNVVSTDRKKIESEYQKEAPGSTTESNADPVHSQNVSERTKPKDLIEKSSSNSINSTQSLVPLTDEHGISDLPKTPASTPTTFMLEVNLEDKNDTEALTSCDENVLNSLERAKKKLMVMDDDTIETFKEEEGKRIFQKPDFQTEDVQQESEYTEHYDIAIQRHLDSLTKSDISIGDNEGINDDGKDLLKGLEDQSVEENESKCREAVALAKAESASNFSLQNKKPEEEVQLATPPRPGTIAEREHKKWENAAPIENNPYSEENIQKRLWERQYSRRSSDIPGINAELPKNNGADLEAILTPHEPNIKRFGRDYYINESKTPSGERGRRSTASISSRPSSSLSQRSNSTGGEQEQQVSFELDKFEEASLRGSLCRWRYRDPYSSPQFAINPLLRLEVDEINIPEAAHHSKGNDEFVKPTDVSNERILLKNRNLCDSRDISSSTVSASKDTEHEKMPDDNLRKLDKDEKTYQNEGIKYSALEKNSTNPDHLHVDTIPKLRARDLDTERNKSEMNDSIKSPAFNPLYEQEFLVERSNADRDSGMYSIDSNDLEIGKDKTQHQDTWKKLFWINDSQNNGKESQILSFNGKRYWNTGSCKYNTFGGIKNPDMRSVNDDSEEDVKLEDPEEFINSSQHDVPEFADLKCQTFGGIKNNKKIDRVGMPTYRRIKLRPVRSLKRLSRCPTEDDCCLQDAGVSHVEGDDENDKDREPSNSRSFEENDWESEDCKDSSTSLNRIFRKHRTPKINSKKCIKKRARSYSKYQSSSEDDWEDEDICVADNMIMTKFLKDASIRTMSHRRSDQESTYFLNTSRRRVLPRCGNSRRMRSQRNRPSSEENDSLKLEPPIVPEVVERSFESLKDLRDTDRKRKEKDLGRHKKFGVRSLSDVTIW